MDVSVSGPPPSYLGALGPGPPKQKTWRGAPKKMLRPLRLTQARRSEMRLMKCFRGNTHLARERACRRLGAPTPHMTDSVPPSVKVSVTTRVPSFGRHKRPFGRLRVQVLGLGPWAPLCFLFFVFPSLPPTQDLSGPPLTEISIWYGPVGALRRPHRAPPGLSGSARWLPGTAIV